MTPTQPTFTGKIEILPDGTVKMYTNPTAPGAVPGDYKIYQRKGRKDWLLMSYKHQVALERLGVAWMEETFGASYEQKVWQIPGIFLCDTTVQGNATTTFNPNAVFCFSPGGGAIKNIIPYMWDNKLQGPVPVVWVTYVHSVVNGKLDKMLQFHLRASDGGDYDNNWTDDGSKLGYWDIDSGGWPYNTDNEGELSRPAEPGVTYQPPRGDSSKYEIGWPLNIDTNDEIKTDADLPFLTIKSGTQSNGNFVETIFDKDRTQAIQFVYRKDDRKDLIQQTIGHMENGKWVQTTTRSEDLFKWILNRLEPPWAEDQGYYGYDPETFEGHWGFRSMEIHWNIDTNPDFTQWWVGGFLVAAQERKDYRRH
jgi:hypothetical protein